MRKRPRSRVLLALAAVALTAGSVTVILASDHQDTPLVEMSPRFDINDVYAFPAPADPTRTVLVLGTRSPLIPAQTAGAAFGTKDQQLYQIKVDNTGDAREDLVFQLAFTGKGDQQKVTLPEATISISKGRETVEVTDIDALPQGFYSLERKADKISILGALKAGEHVPGADLRVGGESLTVRAK